MTAEQIVLDENTSLAHATMFDVPRWGSDTPLVGRRAELASLTSALQRADRGAPSGVLVAGEAGVGKSRLLRAVRDAATEAGALVLTGYCVDVGHGLPYLPFRDAVADVASDPEYAEVIDAVDALTPLVTTDLEATNDVNPIAVFGGMLRLLEVLSADRTVVLILEDLHWVDESSRNLLRFLLSRLRSQRLLVIGSYRVDDVYRTHPLRPLLAELVRMPGVERLDLPRLPDDDLRTLLSELTDSTADSTGNTDNAGYAAHADRAAAIEHIVRQADGNAFYAEELLASRAADLASRVGLTAADRPGSPRSVPEGLTDLLLTRIERLNPSAQRIVRSASVAGRSVRHDLLRQTLSMSDDEVDDGLRDVASHHVMQSDDGESYSFRHALMREAAYSDLLPGERVRLHAAYAEALGAQASPENAAARAHHLYESNNLPAAIRASLDAAEFARRSGAPSQRLAHLEEVLELWNVVPPDQLPDGVTETSVLRRAAAAAVQSGLLKRGVSLLQAAVHASADDDDKATSLGDLASVYLGQNRDREAYDISAEALALSPQPTTARLWALAVHARATLYVLEATHEAAGDPMVTDYSPFDVVAHEALELARTLQRPEIEADVIVTMMSAAQNDRQSAEGQRQLVRALELARSSGRDDVEQRVLFNLAIGHYEAGQLDEALRWAEAGSTLARQRGSEASVYAVNIRGIEVLVLYHQGRWDASLRLANDGSTNDHGKHVELCGAYVRAGRDDPDLPAWIDARLTTGPGLQTGGMYLSWLHGGSAMLERTMWNGDAEAAYDWYRRTVERAVSDFHREPGIRLVALALATFADVPDGWRRRADELIAFARTGLDNHQDRWTCDGPESQAWLLMAEAEYARITGDEPIAKLQVAYDAFGYGDRYRQAICQWRLAELYAAAGDKSAAREHLTEAIEFATKAGADRLLERARDLDARAGLGIDAGSTARADGSPLTARETEVLRQIADGHSNKEIAEALFITTKTASVHVSNILAKLGARRRTAAAAIGRENGWI